MERALVFPSVELGSHSWTVVPGGGVGGSGGMEGGGSSNGERS